LFVYVKNQRSKITALSERIVDISSSGSVKRQTEQRGARVYAAERICVAVSTDSSMPSSCWNARPIFWSRICGNFRELAGRLALNKQEAPRPAVYRKVTCLSQGLDCAYLPSWTFVETNTRSLANAKLVERRWNDYRGMCLNHILEQTDCRSHACLDWSCCLI
jgi:hypothetical protein